MVKTIKDFKKAYKKAVTSSYQDFIFDDYSFLTSYAGYMIEYFKMKNISDDVDFESIVERE